MLALLAGCGGGGGNGGGGGGGGGNNPPPVSVAVTPAGTFTVGEIGATFSVVVSNTSGSAITLAGLGAQVSFPNLQQFVVTAESGNGWTCGANNNCSRTDNLGAGASYPPITVTGNPQGGAGTLQVPVQVQLSTPDNGSGTGIWTFNNSIQIVTVSVAATAGNGQSATVSTAFSTALQATVQDSSGNPVANATVTFTAPSSGPSGTFANGAATTTATTNSSGVATASTFTANSTAGSYNVTASASGSMVTFALTNTAQGAGQPASIASTAGSGQSATVSTAFPTALQATVKDALGNGVPNVTVTFAAPSSGPGGTFANGTAMTTATTNSSGVATASVFTANTASGSYSVTASVAGVAGNAVFSMTNNPAAAASISASAGGGQTATVSTAFTTALQATVKDSGGNAVPNVTVTFSAPASGPSGTFANGTAATTAVTGSTGVATASAFTANTTAGSYTITASVAGITSNAAFSLTNNPGAPASISVAAGGAQSATVSTAFTTALQATVKDANGNAVPNVTVTFTAPSSGPSGTFANGTAATTAVTGITGVATASVFTANSTAGTYSVSASAAGVAASAGFSLSNNATTPLLSVDISGGGGFVPGQQGAIYTITISNSSYAAATSGTLTVTDPPTSFAVTAIAGAGWTCDVATVTCTTTAALAGGQSYPPIVVAGNISSSSPATVGILVEVSGGGMASPFDTTGSIAVNPPPAETSPLTGIAIQPAHVSLSPGNSQPLTATGTYQDGGTRNLTSTVAWSSSSTATATVDATGTVKAVSAGTATVTATSGQIVGSATVNVKSQPPVLAKLAISPVSPSIALGTSLQFKATGIYSDGSTRDLSSQVGWASTANVLVNGIETPVASVSITGLVTATAVGSTNIVAGLITGPGQLTQVESQLIVTGPSIQSIAVTPSAPSIPQGYPQQFDAVATFSDGTTQDVTQSAQWASTNMSVATIGASSGLAMSAGQGTTTISATLGSQSSSATLTVTAAQLTALAVTPPSAQAAAGTPEPFQAWGSFSDGTYLNMTRQVIWSSSAPAVAIVDDTGTATGESAGSATLTAASGSISNTASFTVTAPQCVTVTVDPADPSIPAGEAQPFSATCTFSDGSIQDVTQWVAWSSSSPDVATIDNSQGTDGQATALTPGTTTIAAEYDPLTGSPVSGSTTLTVTQPTPPPTQTYSVTVSSKSNEARTVQEILAVNGASLLDALPLYSLSSGGGAPCFPYEGFLPSLVVSNGQWTPASKVLDISATYWGIASCADLLPVPIVAGSQAIGYSSVSADGTIAGYAAIVGSTTSDYGMAWQVFESWTGNLNTGSYSYSEFATGSASSGDLPPSWCNSGSPAIAPYCPYDDFNGWNLSYSYTETGTLVLNYDQIDRANRQSP